MLDLGGFCLTTFYGCVSRRRLSLRYRVTSFIVFVYSTFTMPAFFQNLLQKSIGVIHWSPYCIAPTPKSPKEIVSFNKCISINVLCLEIKKISDLFTSYLLSESLCAECSDIATCQTVVSLSCRAFSSLQGLVFFLCRKQSIVTRAGGADRWKRMAQHLTNSVLETNC